MKKILSLILTVSLLISSMIFASEASGCSHEYVSVHYDETCVEREKTVYTCSHCGDSYTEYVKGYTEPDGFYFLLDSTRDGDVLTVKVYQYNNPGVSGEKVEFSCNTNALSLISVENGDCFPDAVYGGLQAWNKLPFSVALMTQEDHSKNVGLFFTVKLLVIDDSFDYDVNLTYKPKDIVDWDDTLNNIVCRDVECINLVGKNKLAPHTYTDKVVSPTCTSEGKTVHTCSVCGFVSESDTVPMIPHDFVFSRHVCLPDFDNEGTDEYKCSVCYATEERPVQKLEHWMKADLNNDGSVTSIDSNIMIKINTGAISPDVYLYDAADLNCDGSVTSIDSNMIIYIILGKEI